MDVHYTLIADDSDTLIIKEVRGGVAAVEQGATLLTASPFAKAIRVQFNEEIITMTKKKKGRI